MTDTPDFIPRAFPISVKGVVLDHQSRVLLRRNEREEWELPGGKLELGEEPAACVVRRTEAESGWKVNVGPLLDVWMYEPIPGRYVFMVTYGCALLDAAAPVVSGERREIGLFGEEEIAGLVMPQGYKESITRWYSLLRSTDSKKGEVP
ncbi:8-oxo-dGTP pyrophosphatase MutT (NUDIX family) [Kitasatospora sp. MAA4]|uniref:NUDIX domain-containing protein n=1 Tax=Kitasatospora sp. MAA4 TaxID=3035093 RepID=UPI002473AAE1|nr:NUDIX domain-containing protein [Kitasatospora sp. MAA4]MDH6132434.1 8-oxo-dGTP pyrophosphatase MutT (NUDIX family) [Kitasatospora sp. MAA4]